jgi:hypothetical protein
LEPVTRRSRGLTLIEAIIAAALAVVLGFLMLQFIKSSLGAHRKGQLGRTAQAGTRNLVGLLVSELRSASVPPLTSPVTDTPVFWPGVWGPTQESASLGAFYPREELDEAGKKRDLATNRLFYVRAADNSDSTNMDPLAHYALVELLVPDTAPGRIERRVHPLTGLPQLLQAATVQGADNTNHQGWVLDGATVAALPAPTAPDVLFDGGPDSRVAFRVSHLQFEPPSDPGRTRYPEIYDPGVFRIEVAVAFDPELSSAVNQPWPAADQWEVLRNETTELRIPSVRSN